jgi:hypothetical protein
MKHLLFKKIEVYDWHLHVVMLDLDSDIEEVKEFVEDKLELHKEDVSPIENIKGMVDGGSHYYNLDERKSIILLYPMTSRARLCNILGHEMQHVVDRIMDYCGIDDLEARAYLAGHLAETVWPSFFTLSHGIALTIAKKD